MGSPEPLPYACIGNDNVDALVRGFRGSSLKHAELIVPCPGVGLDETDVVFVDDGQHGLPTDKGAVRLLTARAQLRALYLSR